MMITRIDLLRVAVVVAAFSGAIACTETKTVTTTDTVFVPLGRFVAPPDSNYLGYYADSTTTPPNQLPTCGNCHVGQQKDWANTAHSRAWADLVSINQQGNAVCQGCHTVNPNGNQPVGTPPAAWTAAKWGWDSVQSVRYHDVQCESCHGPGHYQQANGDNSKAHVVNPTIIANRPLASMDLGDTAALSPAKEQTACGACHTDAGTAKHHNFLKEWKASRHAIIRNPAGSPAGNASCQPCHEGKGALAAWGVVTNYRELGTNTPTAINCVVCHDPHGTAKDAAGNPLPGQLRFPLDAQVLSLNLCTHCHNRRPDPVSSGSGPHGVQGPVLFGTAGYFPPGTVYDTTAILTTHGSTANPRLCAGCHVNQYTAVDHNNNSVTFFGHTFHPLPCLATPDTTVDTTFTNGCAYDEPSRSWKACTASGCHGTAAVAVSRLLNIRTEVKGYLDVIWVDKNANQTIDPYPADTGYLAKLQADTVTRLSLVPAGYNCAAWVTAHPTGPGCGSGKWQLDNSTNILTSAKGARFNAQMTGDSIVTGIGEGLSAQADASHGVHNPFLYRALLQSTIADLVANYGGAVGILPAPPAPVLSKIQASLQNRQLRLSPQLTQAMLSPQVISRK